MRRGNRAVEVFSISALDLFAATAGVFIIFAVMLFPYYLNEEESADALLDATEAMVAMEKEMAEANTRAQLAVNALESERQSAIALALQTEEAQASEREALEALARETQRAADLESEMLRAQSLLSEASATSAELESEVAVLQSELEMMRSEDNSYLALAAEAREELQICEAELSKTFLIVGIEWQTVGVDVDLMVTDPEGNKFKFSKPNRNQTCDGNDCRGSDFDSPAQLSYDMVVGPGIEIWQHPLITPGEYLIEYKLYGNPDANVTVTGSLYDRLGRRELPPKQLSRRNQIVVGAKVTVDVSGSITVD